MDYIHQIITVLIVETIILSLAIIVILVTLYRRREGCMLWDCVCPMTKSIKKFDIEAEEAVNKGICICFRCGCGKNAATTQEKEDEVKIVVREDEKNDGKFIQEILKPAKATEKGRHP
jgi:hypothetical protein